MEGDAMNAILCGVGHNLRKILAHIRALLYLLASPLRTALQALLAHLESIHLPQQPSDSARIG